MSARRRTPRERKDNMKTTLLVLSLLLAGEASGQSQGKFGAGFIFGEPTGIAWKYRISQSNAVDGAIGFSPYDRYRLHMDYLWQSYPFSEPRLSVHYGVGAAVGFGRSGYVVYRGRFAYFVSDDQDIGFAARVPVGLSYQIPRSPVDLFVEVAPMVIFAPNGGIGIDGGLGARFYF